MWFDFKNKYIYTFCMNRNNSLKDIEDILIYEMDKMLNENYHKHYNHKHIFVY